MPSTAERETLLSHAAWWLRPRGEAASGARDAGGGRAARRRAGRRSSRGSTTARRRRCSRRARSACRAQRAARPPATTRSTGPTWSASTVREPAGRALGTGGGGAGLRRASGAARASDGEARQRGSIPFVEAYVERWTSRRGASTSTGRRITEREGRRRAMRIDVVTLFPEMVAAGGERRRDGARAGARVVAAAARGTRAISRPTRTGRWTTGRTAAGRAW